MTSRALGLIEVKGYLGAVVAADAAVKAANVSLLNIETVKAGLNTVQLVGDVSAVRSAVDAAVAAVQDEPYYLTSHVIARLDQQTDILFEKREKEMENPVSSLAQDIKAEKESPIAEVVDQVSEEKASENTFYKYTEAELEKLKVVQLRSLAYQEKTVRLSKKEIKFANKRLLIDALMEIKGKE